MAVAGPTSSVSEPSDQAAKLEAKPGRRRQKKQPFDVAEKPAAKVAEKSEKQDSTTRKKVAEKSAKSGAGSGSRLSPVPDWEPIGKVAWEARSDRPGFQAWFAPEGKGAHRRTKTYLGYLPTVELEMLDAEAVRALVEDWKKKKGIQ